MNQYLLIAIAVLTLALGGTGWLLKNQIGKSAVLASEVRQHDEAVKRLTSQIAQQEAERGRIDQLLSERDERNREAEARAARFSDALRLARKANQDFDRCLDLPVDSNLVDRVYSIWPGGDQGGKTAPAKPSSQAVRSAGQAD